MNIIKTIIGLPLLVALLVFAFVNNDFATFSFWPFYLEITISLSVAILFLFLAGFMFGSFFTWLSYAPALHSEKRQNKKLAKNQKKLTEKVSTLKEDVTDLKKQIPFKERFKNFFKRKPQEKIEERW